MSDTSLVFNGVDGETGGYLLSPKTVRDVARLARGTSFEPAHLEELKWRLDQGEHRLGLRYGLDPRKLDEAGWGVIFAHDADPAIREALSLLLDHRRAQASKRDTRLFQEYANDRGYHPGESKDQFIVERGAAPGPVNPTRMPYYLLIVGSPEEIPFSFQHELDVAYAVGRIHFDGVDEYANYARGVVAAEQQSPRSSRRAAFFGVKNADDEATRLSAEILVSPLAEHLQAARPAWTIQTMLGTDARKARLVALLGGPETPDLLFTASHGVAFAAGDPRQVTHQGALLCQDWPGPAVWGTRPLSPSFYVRADDVSSDARLGGLIAFHFACYSAGTPRYDEFAHRGKSRMRRTPIASRAFVADLPRRVLGHPNGGALAVVGHVDRTWGSSFSEDGIADAHLTTFESTLEQILDGYPVGAALEAFNQRYAELSTSVSALLYEARFGNAPDDAELAAMWTANNDARNYAIIGDPAVRLSLLGSTPPREHG